MKKPFASFLPVVALSMLAACSGGSAAAVGTYQLDVDSMFAAMSADMKGAPPEMLAEVKKNMKGAIELKADQTATLSFDMGMPMAPKINETGTWKLDGATLTMTTKKGDKDDVKSAKLADGAITIEEDAGGKKMKMVFKKK